MAVGLASPRASEDLTEPARLEARRPNVVLLLTDDQTVSDMRALPAVRTRIEAQGTTFTRAYSTYPLCCPSRATILTGQYAHNHGVMDNVAPAGGFSRFDDDETLAVWLQRSGYNTILLGKYLNGYHGKVAQRYVPPGWSEWQAAVKGVYDYRSSTINENGRMVSYQRGPIAHVALRGADLITRYAAQDAPFFLFASFIAPHSGTPVEPDDPATVNGSDALQTAAVAPRYQDAFEDAALPDKPSIFERDMEDKSELRDVRRRPRWEYREAYQQRLEALLSVGDAIDRLLDALEASGESNDTVVIFASDNGHLVGEHWVYNKRYPYEESVRVPLAVSGPGFPAGVRRDQLVTLADITSTIVKAAGSSPGLVQDGRPLQPLALDPDAGAGRDLVLEAGPGRDTGGRRLYTALRTSDDRVLIAWHSGAVELYHLDEDPYQLDGGLDGSETSEERDRLLARLAKLQDCVGPECG